MHYAPQLPQTVVLVIQSIGGDKDIINIFTYVFLIFPTFGYVIYIHCQLPLQDITQFIYTQTVFCTE